MSNNVQLCSSFYYMIHRSFNNYGKIWTKTENSILEMIEFSKNPGIPDLRKGIYYS